LITISSSDCVILSFLVALACFGGLPNGHEP